MQDSGDSDQHLEHSSELTVKETFTHVVFINPVYRWLSDTTAHGLDRLVGLRPIYVKFIWLVGFALGLAVFVSQVQTFLDTFNQQPETTTLKQNAIEFNFPDIYICNKAIMSGSYPYTMSPSNVSVINSYVNQVLSVLGVPKTQIHASFFAKTLLATMPYRLISDLLGQQTIQFLLR